MMRRYGLLLAIAVLVTACGRREAPAQRRPALPPGPDSAAGEVVAHDTLAAILATRGRYKRVEEMRTSNGRPEIHDDFEDVVLVRSGHATLLSGGHVVGGRMVSPGEPRGGPIVGGRSRSLAPGDEFTIAAGVPHQYRIATGEAFRYLTVKVPRRAR